MISFIELRDLIGFLSYLFLFLSTCSPGEKRIRVYGVISTVFFLVYGFTLDAYPMIICNIALININIIRLWYLFRKEKKNE